MTRDCVTCTETEEQGSFRSPLLILCHPLIFVAKLKSAQKIGREGNCLRANLVSVICGVSELLPSCWWKLLVSNPQSWQPLSELFSNKKPLKHRLTFNNGWELADNMVIMTQISFQTLPEYQETPKQAQNRLWIPQKWRPAHFNLAAIRMILQSVSCERNENKEIAFF